MNHKKDLSYVGWGVLFQPINPYDYQPKIGLDFCPAIISLNTQNTLNRTSTSADPSSYDLAVKAVLEALNSFPIDNRITVDAFRQGLEGYLLHREINVKKRKK